MTAVEITVVGPAQWLLEYADTLLNKKLIACSQMVPIHSRYWWKRTIEEAEELKATFHTTETHRSSLMERIAAEHPYEVACVLARDLDTVSPPYLAWIRDSVEESADV